MKILLTLRLRRARRGDPFRVQTEIWRRRQPAGIKGATANGLRGQVVVAFVVPKSALG